MTLYHPQILARSQILWLAVWRFYLTKEDHNDAKTSCLGDAGNCWRGAAVRLRADGAAALAGGAFAASGGVLSSS